MENRPTGVFWWGFYDNSSVDEFFEAALNFISGGTIDPRRIPSSSAKAQVVAALLANGSYLFVLDGLEVLQRQEGDQYGLLTSPDLLTFLELFAAPDHNSFCLITSRAPLLDLMAYTSYIHRDVGPVSFADGRSLLRALGVHGRDDELDSVTAQWDGHALTLSLLGTYLQWQHDGAVAYADQFDPVDVADVNADAPDAAKQRYAHVHRILRHYDQHLTAAERAFMMLFSAFRTPVAADAFARVFRGEVVFTDSTDEKGAQVGAPIRELDDSEFEALLARLVGYRLLRFNADAGTYTTHPLVRGHYLARLTGSGQAAQTHAQLQAYYLELAGDTPYNPTLEQLAPLIEVVYHACRAGAYDEAEQIRWERIDKRNQKVVIHQLGAYETQLAIIQQFFLDGDTSQEPQVSKASDKSWILNEVGLCHMSLGRLETAVGFYERGNQMVEELEDWQNAGRGYQNLAQLNINLGRLAAAASAATQALQLARRAANKRVERNSLKWQAWTAHLRGEVAAAGEAFRQAQALQRDIDSSVQYLYSLPGINHAEHLRRVGAADTARRVATANLEICELNRFIKSISQCHRILGELDAAGGQNESARAHFDSALTIARGISDRAVLIEALLARGRWAARLAFAELTSFNPQGLQSRPSENLSILSLLPQAFSDLNEALGYATDGGYRIYEADIRNALAWAHLAAGAANSARQEATRARSMSQEMGYHWGQVDADELLAAIP